MRNTADSMVYQAEKMLREQGDRMPSEVRSDVEAKVAALKPAIDANDVAAMSRAIEELQQASADRRAHLRRACRCRRWRDGAKGADAKGPEQAPEGAVEGEFREV